MGKNICSKTDLKKNGCPICGIPSIHDYRPFCSDRCSNIDLSRWLGGAYSVPVVQLEESDTLELEKFIEDKDS